MISNVFSDAEGRSPMARSTDRQQSSMLESRLRKRLEVAQFLGMTENKKFHLEMLRGRERERERQRPKRCPERPPCRDPWLVGLTKVFVFSKRRGIAGIYSILSCAVRLGRKCPLWLLQTFRESVLNTQPCVSCPLWERRGPQKHKGRCHTEGRCAGGETQKTEWNTEQLGTMSHSYIAPSLVASHRLWAWRLSPSWISPKASSFERPLSGYRYPGLTSTEGQLWDKCTGDTWDIWAYNTERPKPG